MVAVASATAMLPPLNLLSLQPFHHDEALYATWGLTISSGIDPWLTDTPIDKPPLFLYLVAGAMHLLGASETAARIPSLMATGLTILLTFLLGCRLYSCAVGLLAAWLMALSPFVLSFAPTAFTDPLLVMWVLTACLAAGYGRPGWAGVSLGLAIATKQQGLFFAPLVIGLLALETGEQQQKSGARSGWSGAIRFALALIITLLPALVWDAARNQPSGFLESSFNNYGGLSFDLAGVGERWLGFADLLRYATNAPLLNLIFLGGLPLLLTVGWWLDRRSVAIDGLLVLFLLGFLLLHTLFSFQMWDRYLLGLMPLLALLLARILWLPPTIYDLRITIYDLQKPVPQYRPFTIHNSQLAIRNFLWGGAITLLLVVTLAAPVNDAINGRYPLGSNSNALRGIEQVSHYLRGNFGADTTLHHRWLGTHWRFYLWTFPYDLQHWDSPEALAAKAGAGHLIAFPAHRSSTEARIALYRAGLALQELTRAHAPNGDPTIILYQITEAR